ncbi:MAG: bacillithiol biosynthesis BshC [Thermoanaerobaculia bacterium]
MIERRAEVEAALRQAERATEERGYELQVAAQRDTSPLFLLRDGLRRRIEWIDDGHFRLRGSDAGAEPEPVARLLETIADNPAVVSPGVLARPAIQDAVFGTTLQIMGPAETAYLAQARAIYPLLELAAPTTALRPQALVVESRQRQQLDELGSSVAELLYRPERLARRLAERAGGGFVAAERGGVEAGRTAAISGAGPRPRISRSRGRRRAIRCSRTSTPSRPRSKRRRRGATRSPTSAGGSSRPRSVRRASRGAPALGRLLSGPLRRRFRGGAPRPARARSAPPLGRRSVARRPDLDWAGDESQGWNAIASRSRSSSC